MASTSTFLDYCLSCDRQIENAGEVYCSQQCRLADLCTSPSSSNGSLPPTPISSSHLSQNSSATPVTRHGPSNSISSALSTAHHGSSKNPANAFVLPPAYDFSSHRHSTASTCSASSVLSMASSHRSGSSMTAPRLPSGYFAYANSNTVLLSSSEAAKRTLSPTSSRSSITSAGDEARNELRAYESGFDVTRAWRRRRASVYDGVWRH